MHGVVWGVARLPGPAGSTVAVEYVWGVVYSAVVSAKTVGAKRLERQAGLLFIQKLAHDLTGDRAEAESHHRVPRRHGDVL